MRRQNRLSLKQQQAAGLRSGHIMVLFSILLVLLLGFAGLVFDLGRLLAAHREAQNAADATALAAAMAKFRKFEDDFVLAEANLMRIRNSRRSMRIGMNAGLSNSLNIPPQAGPHQGDPDFCEAYVTVPMQTWFIHILGIAQDRVVAARAVAGQDPPSEGEGVIVLDPQAISGLTVNANGSQDPTLIRVDGGVLVNSLGNGYNQWGQWVDTYPPELAPGNGGNGGNTSPGISAQTSNQTPGPSIEARSVISAGGTESSNAAVFKFYGDSSYPNGVNPLHAGTGLLFPDPLRDLPVPQPGVDSRVDITLRDESGDDTPDGNVNLGTGDVETLQPGLYHDIRIVGSADVTFAPGIYIISPTQPNDGIVINGSPAISGDGVMFYLTGSNYMDAGQSPGYWDALDDSSNNQLDGPLPTELAAPTASTVWNTQTGQTTNPPGTDPYNDSVRWATVDINIGDGVLDLRGLDAIGESFDNMLFFARRRNNQEIKIAGNAGNSTVNLEGVVYAKWSLLSVSGGGSWTAQFVVGSLKASGGTVLNILDFGTWFGFIKQVYLVE